MDDKFEYEQPDMSWNSGDEMLGSPDYETYTDTERYPLVNSKSMLSSNMMNTNSRDPRSKSNSDNLTELLDYGDRSQEQKSKKKNLSDAVPALTPNDYQNIYAARNRLLHDLNEVPNEILRQTFEKNKALRQSRDGKLQERDLRNEKKDDEKDIQKKEAKNIEQPETLWDLESEKELEDRENGYYRGKRETEKEKIKGIPQMTTTGGITSNFDLLLKHFFV